MFVNKQLRWQTGDLYESYPCIISWSAVALHQQTARSSGQDYTYRREALLVNVAGDSLLVFVLMHQRHVHCLIGLKSHKLKTTQLPTGQQAAKLLRE